MNTLLTIYFSLPLVGNAWSCGEFLTLTRGRHFFAMNTEYIFVPKTLHRQFGIRPSVTYALLQEAYIIAGKPEWLAMTTRDLEELTTLSYIQQKKVLRTLKMAKLIEVKLIGTPAKQHIKILKP